MDPHGRPSPHDHHQLANAVFEDSWICVLSCLSMIYSIYDGIYDGAKRLDRMKLRSQTSDLWTDAATVVRAVREEKESEEKESEQI